MKSNFSCARIKGIATCIPKYKIHLHEQADLFYQGDLKKVSRIKKSIGLDARYITDNQTTTLDLCLKASKHLLQSFEKIQVDALVFVTQTPDYLQPNNAHLLHHFLHLSHDCACFDINQGCSGYVYGLFLAYSLIEKGAENVLLCSGDTLSKVVNYKDSNTAPLFGDAGSATLISKAKDKSYFTLHSDGSGWENIILPQSAFRDNSKLQKTNQEAKHLSMDGAEIFNFSISKEPEAILEILNYANISSDLIDYIFFHQANAYIISNIMRKLNIDSRKAPLDSISKYGNTSSASIPLAICDCLHQTKDQDQTLILSGFGVGLSWATALLTLQKNTIIKKPIFYEGD